MALRSDRDALLAAWRGLNAGGLGDGWQAISLGKCGVVEIRAAKLFPGHLEAFLVGYPNAPVPADTMLPQAKGFYTSRVKLQGDASTWVAVVRNGGGSLDLFTAMASDVLALLQSPGLTAAVLLHQVIARITAWQRFMERGGNGLLSPEEEVGLFGELVVLRTMLDEAQDKTGVIECWSGPLGALHDFPIGTGAIEVKSTLAPFGFPARIIGLEQLDTSAVDPLFVAGVRLATDPGGATLGDLATEILNLVSADGSAAAALADRLISAGLPNADYVRYTRRFKVGAIQLHRVTATFPRLVRGNTPPQITAVRYTLDLDLLVPDVLSVSEARDILRIG